VLSDNLFSGLIPSQLGSLPNLEKFSAHRRSKPGPRLSGTLPAFDNAPLLTDLYLDHNDLEGTIPSNFLSASPLASLIVLSHNGLLNGTVPVELDSISALDLQLEGNRISKVPNEFCDNSDWMDGALGRVGCDAFLCPPGTANLIGRANDTLVSIVFRRMQPCITEARRAMCRRRDGFYFFSINDAEELNGIGEAGGQPT
jgi:hypothetical protein